MVDIPLPPTTATYTDPKTGQPTGAFFDTLRKINKGFADLQKFIDDHFPVTGDNVVGSPVTDRTYSDHLRDLPSVLDLGMKADGSNNAPLYSDMIDYCAANDIGAVWVPEGDYSFASYPNKQLTVSLIGAGRGKARFLRNFSGTTDQGLIEPGSGVSVRDLAVIGGTTGSNLVIKGGVSKVCLSGLDLGGTTTLGLRVNTASNLSISDCATDDVSLVSLTDSNLDFSTIVDLTMASVTSASIRAGRISGNLSVDANCLNSRINIGALFGSYSNLAPSVVFEDGRVWARLGDGDNGLQFLPNRRIRKWMTVTVNNTTTTFSWATQLSGFDVAFAAAPDVVGFYNASGSVAGGGWQSLTATTVDIHTTALNVLRFVAEGTY